MAYAIAFAQLVREQLLTLTARERTRVLDAIEEQLSHQPLVETKHRKALRPNPIAPWELRAGYFRVFYDVAADEPDTVRILACRTEERRQALFRRPGDQVMRTIELSDASKPLSDYAEALDDDILVLTSKKKPGGVSTVEARGSRSLGLEYQSGV